MVWQRFLHAQRVVVVASDISLTCCWKRGESWCWRQGSLPMDSCRDGLPLQQEIVGDFLADLLLDSGVVGAQIELLLPSGACQWRVLDGPIPADRSSLSRLARGAIADQTTALSAQDLYVSTPAWGDSTLAIGVSRALLQAWIGVMEVADLPLQRVEWSLVSALRALRDSIPDWSSGALLWLIQPQETSPFRVLILRDGTPEVDRTIPANDKAAEVVREIIQAWSPRANQPLRWVSSVGDGAHVERWFTADNGRSWEHVLPDIPWTVEPWDPGLEPGGLDPLTRLTLAGLQESLDR